MTAFLFLAGLVVHHLAGPTTGGGFVDGAAARFSNSRQVAVDAAGNIYVADSGNNAIRKIAPDGTVSTLAGDGRFGSADGAGRAARFSRPSGLALAPDGSLIVADTGSGALRRVTMDGQVTTIASRLQGGPTAVAIDSDGTVYLADGNAVERLDASGVTTLAGDRLQKGNVDGQGTAARFNEPVSLAIGPDDAIYVADRFNGSRIRRVTRDGAVTTFLQAALPPIDVLALRFDERGRLWLAGAGGVWHVQNGIIVPLALTPLSTPPLFTGIAFDAHGNAILADAYANAIRSVAPNGAASLIAGSPVQSGLRDGDAASALFSYPFALAAAADGRILVGTFDGIREISPAGLVSSAGYGVNPVGLAVHPNGDVYGSTSTVVWKRSPSGVVTNLAGVEGERGLQNGRGSEARFGYAYGLAVDADGSVYIADTWNNCVRKIDAGGNVTTYAGTGVGGHLDGSREVAQFQSPKDVLLDGAGNLFILDEDSSIRWIDREGMVRSLPRHPFNEALKFARDADGYFYAASQRSIIYRISPAGDVETVAGLSDISGNIDGTGGQARFSGPSGIVVMPDGRLVIADSLNHCIRVASLPPVIERFAAEPAPGGATLTWSSHYAASATIGSIGAVPPAGSVFAAGPGPFTLTVMSEGGSATATALLRRRHAASH